MEQPPHFATEVATSHAQKHGDENMFAMIAAILIVLWVAWVFRVSRMNVL
jgi:flagellar biogenesis protein FliO